MTTPTFPQSLAFLFLAACLMSGCARNDGTSITFPEADNKLDASSPDTPFALATGDCPPGFVWMVSGDHSFDSFCGQTCTSSAECPTGMICVQEIYSYATPHVPVCVSDSVPPPRSSPRGDPGFEKDVPTCVDSVTLGRRYINTMTGFIGTELIFCPNGCQHIPSVLGYGAIEFCSEIPLDTSACDPFAQRLPGDVHFDYAASLPDGQLLVVTCPTGDWTDADLRLFIGPLTALAERKVSSIDRAQDGGSIAMTFAYGGISAVAKIPVAAGDGGFGPGPATLEKNGISTVLTPLSAQPAGASYLCLVGSCAVVTDVPGPYEVTFVLQNPGSTPVFIHEIDCGSGGYAINLSSCSANFSEELFPTSVCPCDCSDLLCTSVCSTCQTHAAIEVSPGGQVTMKWQAETIKYIALGGPSDGFCNQRTPLPAARYRVAVPVVDDPSSTSNRLVRADFTLPAPNNQVVVNLAP